MSSTVEIAGKIARAWTHNETLEIDGQFILSTSSNPETVLADYVSTALDRVRGNVWDAAIDRIMEIDTDSPKFKEEAVAALLQARVNSVEEDKKSG